MRLLVETRVDPVRILLVTFTRVAARDLQKKLKQLKVPNATKVQAGTLHAFCFSILNRADVMRLTGRTPRTLLEFEERFLLEDLKSPELGDYYQRRKDLRAFEAAWAREEDQDPGWPQNQRERVFQNLLYDWLQFHEAMLVGQLVPETLKYLRNNPQCPERGMFDHVLVDEYQDLNRAEQSLIDLLSSEGTLTVVGDEDQSIYETFRYAHPQGIAHFDRAHPGTYDVPFTFCRRCPKRIVNMGNALIQHNIRRTDRQLKANPGAPEGEIHIVQWKSMTAEAEGLADFIQRKRTSRDFVTGETLVLCPRRQFGYMIRDALTRRDVPAHSFFHQEELEGYPKDLSESKGQQAFTLLTLLANPRDRVALRCWLGFGHQNLRREQYEVIKEYCIANRKDPSYTLDALCDGRLVIPHIEGLLDRYRLLKSQLAELEGKTGSELCNMLFPPDADWAEPFCVLTKEFSQSATPKEILDALRTSIIQPELPTDVDYIRIMSLHKSKGLNVDNVIVTGFVQGLIPQIREDMTPEDKRIAEEEQRRLFYVAITRARKTLVLSSVFYLPLKLAYKMEAVVKPCGRDLGRTFKSTFVDELGPSRPDPIRGEDWRY